VDNRDRPSTSSSDPSSAIEGFRQKVPLHNKLADTCVKLGDLAIPTFLSLGAFLVEHLDQLRDRLTLSGREPRRMEFVLGGHLSNRQMTLDRLSGTSP
jgi:hypothetical protein